MIIEHIALTVALWSALTGSFAATTANAATLDDLNRPVSISQTTTNSYKTKAAQREQARRQAAAVEDYYAQKLVTLPLRLRPGTDHRKDSKPTIATTRQCRSIVYQTYIQLPTAHTQYLHELTLYYTNDGRRGLGGNGSIVLRCLNVEKSELAAVFVHEIGHVVDGSYLTGKNFSKKSNFYDFDQNVASDDPSLKFYSISWDSEKKRSEQSTETDFVSLYAMSDPFEDFAETYMFYRLHGGSFRYLAKTSPGLNAKYAFMRNYVFSGKEFGDDTVLTYSNTKRRQYDATVIPFNLESFLNNAWTN